MALLLYKSLTYERRAMDVVQTSEVKIDNSSINVIIAFDISLFKNNKSIHQFWLKQFTID